MSRENLGCICLLAMHQLNGVSNNTKNNKKKKLMDLCHSLGHCVSLFPVGVSQHILYPECWHPTLLNPTLLDLLWLSAGQGFCLYYILCRFSASVIPLVCLIVKGQSWGRTQAYCLHACPLQMGYP